MFSLIFVWINGWVNNREAGDLRRHRAHCDVIVMWWRFIVEVWDSADILVVEQNDTPTCVILHFIYVQLGILEEVCLLISLIFYPALYLCIHGLWKEVWRPLDISYHIVFFVHMVIGKKYKRPLIFYPTLYLYTYGLWKSDSSMIFYSTLCLCAYGFGKKSDSLSITARGTYLRERQRTLNWTFCDVRKLNLGDLANHVIGVLPCLMK